MWHCYKAVMGVVSYKKLTSPLSLERPINIDSIALSDKTAEKTGKFSTTQECGANVYKIQKRTSRISGNVK